MGWGWSELQNKSDDEIIAEHDARMASGMNVGVGYFVQEIYNRRQSRIARRIFYLTIIITILTLINVVVAIALWKQECDVIASVAGGMDFIAKSLFC